MICKNCEHNFEGNFCNSCGQNSNVQKIDFKYLLDEISNSVLQVNRGVFFTIKELFIRPGHTIREFLEGKRKQHFKPLAYVLLISTVYVLVTYWTGENTYLGDTLTGISDGLSENTIESSTSTKILNWLSNNHAYATLILLPIFSFASYLSFRKVAYNYFEHLILNFYITGQQMVIYVVFALLYFMIDGDSYFFPIIPFGLAVTLTFWTFIQFFQNKKPVVKIFLTLLTYFLYLLFTFTTIYLVGYL